MAQGVLVLKGSDQRNTLQHALDFLATCPEKFTKEYIPCDIDLVNVRGLGPYGGVLIRFDALESLLQSLPSDREDSPLHRLNSLFAADMKSDAEPLIAEIYPSFESYTHHPSITHQTFIRTGLDPQGYSFRSFLAILSADPYIDISSYDCTLMSNDSMKEAWRVYDTMGRGTLWLRNTLEHANRLSHAPESNNQYEPHEEHVQIDFPLQPLDLQGFNQSTLELGNFDTDLPLGSYLYFRLYCQDCPGLFAAIHRFARTATADPNSFTARHVLRSSCAGIGGRAIAIVVTPDDGTQDIEVLQKHFGSFIHKEMRRRLNGPIGKIDARVTHSSFPPTVCGSKKHEMLVTANFECVVNRPMILRHIIQSASSVTDANPSVYYLSSRLKHAGRRSPFLCSIGWVINPASLYQFQKAVDSVIRPLCDPECPPTYSPHLDPSMLREIKASTPSTTIVDPE